MNRSKLINGGLAAVPLLFVLVYGGGYIAQLIRNYKEWEQNGGMLGSGTSPPLPDSAEPFMLRKMPLNNMYIMFS